MDKSNSIQVFREQLWKYSEAVERLLRQHKTTAEKFLTTVDNAVRRNPKLLECDRRSLFGAVLTSAELGLVPNTPMQYAYIIPYKREATFQIGYHGVIALMYRSSMVTKVTAELVYENDQFDRWMDDSLNWRFTFKPDYTNPGKRVGVFAVVHLKNAEPAFKFMSADEIAQIKALSRSPQTYDPVRDPQGWMWKKSVIKQLAKTLPVSDDAKNAIAIDSAVEGGAVLLADEEGHVIRQENPITVGTNVPSVLSKLYDKESV